MDLMIDKMTKVYNLSQIGKGCLIYAKHTSWSDGKAGFITAVSERELIVQYHPGIGNITNHFFLPADEVAAGEWELRWSVNLSEVYEFMAAGGKYGNT